jgi:tyrosine-protein kinase Etk/Wzc
MEDASGGVELREIAAALRRGRLWVVGGALFGLLVGAAVAFRVTPRYEARTSVLIQSETEGASGALSKLSGLLGGMGGGISGSKLETEVAVLKSRTVLGEVIDSLGLQVRVVEPAAAEPHAFFSVVRVAERADDAEYSFTRARGAYEVSGDGYRGTVAPGGTLRLPDATLTLRSAGLPAEFRIAVADRESTIDQVDKALKLDTDQGDVVTVQFRAAAPSVTAEVLNRMVRTYLRRRTTTDRGVNQHRYEFLSEQVDSVERQLERAAGLLRQEQESSGVLNPEVQGQTELERAMAVQADLEAISVEARALEQIIDRGKREGHIPTRELAAYPSLLKNPAVNEQLSRLLAMETDRTRLMGDLRANNPEIATLDRMIAQADAQLMGLAQDYLSGLHRQESGLRRDLASYQARLGVLPAQAEQAFRREREVKRLSETLIALQSQVVQARLDALSEGGQVRQVDVAIPPKRPVFPNKPLSLFGGLLGGLFFGLVAGVAAGRRGKTLDEAWEVELATGIRAIDFDPRLPLGYGEVGSGQTLLVLPVGPGDSATRVGEKIARTAASQGENAEVSVLPGMGNPETMAALRPGRMVVLTAIAGRVSRAELASTVALCRQMDVLPLGVVLVPAGGDGARG